MASSKFAAEGCSHNIVKPPWEGPLDEPHSQKYRAISHRVKLKLYLGNATQFMPFWSLFMPTWLKRVHELPTVLKTLCKMNCVRKLNEVQLVMCTYLAPGPNSLRKAVWMYPGCLHPTVEAGAPGSFQKGYKSTQKLKIQQEKRSNVSTNSSLRMRRIPQTSDF